MSTLRVDTLVNRVGNGAPNFAYGLTAPSAVFTGNVSIGGTLTYEDVQNVDAVGLITARQNKGYYWWYRSFFWCCNCYII